MIKAIKTYFQESVQEMHNVTWPTQSQAIRITTIVFVFMIVAAAALGLIDQLLSVGYRALISLPL